MYMNFVKTGEITDLKPWSESSKKEFNLIESFPTKFETRWTDECDMYDVFDKYLTV